jgi:hypothetical protein
VCVFGDENRAFYFNINDRNDGMTMATSAIQEESNINPWTHVKFDTSIGSFVIELYHRHAPRTCYNVAALAHAGYYDNTVFHRIIRDFMIQGGDPTATGRGGESVSSFVLPIFKSIYKNRNTFKTMFSHLASVCSCAAVDLWRQV